MMKQRGFQLINPTEKWFPGLMELREKYVSRDWWLGKTPAFTVQKEFVMKSDDKNHNVQLMIDVRAVSVHFQSHPKQIINKYCLMLFTENVDYYSLYAISYVKMGMLFIVGSRFCCTLYVSSRVSLMT